MNGIDGLKLLLWVHSTKQIKGDVGLVDGEAGNYMKMVLDKIT